MSKNDIGWNAAAITAGLVIWLTMLTAAFHAGILGGLIVLVTPFVLFAVWLAVRAILIRLFST